MQLPLTPPVKPMLAKPVAQIPAGMAYEPKWDGFRCIVFRDGDEVYLQSRNLRDLTVYFPEVVDALRENIPARCVLDGELVIVWGDRLDFDRLTERIHPAQVRIDKLSATTPASFVAWDILAIDDEDLTAKPMVERRALLERALADASAPVFITPFTTDGALAQEWFSQFEGAGLDGVVAKPLDGTYQPDQRTMFKIKHKREADVVVGGYRLHKNSSPERPLLGSLQLGLYDSERRLHWVGVAASFPESVRAELAQWLGEVTVPFDSPAYTDLEWSEAATPGGPRRPGTASRWGSDKDKVFYLIDPMLVATVAYEHMEGTRFRHTAQFLRWRPDREPESCGFDQLEEVVKYDLAEVLARN